MLIFVISAVVYFGIVTFIAQRMAPEEYNSRSNTLNELACQSYENRTTMQWGFKGLGIIIFAGIIVNINDAVNEPYYYVPLGFFSIFTYLSGVFSTKPFEHLVFYSIKEFKLNSLFNQLSGLSISLLIVMKLFVELGSLNRVINIMVLILNLYLSIQVGRKSINRGIYQRVLYFISFLWLIYANSVMMN